MLKIPPWQACETDRRVSYGFSLLESLAVVAIISLTLGLMVPSASHLARSGRLVAGGNAVVDLAKLARANAITKNAMTALVLVTKAGHAAGYDNRLFCLMEWTADAESWKQISPWHVLPEGTLADLSRSSFSSPISAPSIDNLRYRGSAVAEYLCQIFRSDGSLETETGASPSLVIVEGRIQEGGLAYTATAGGAPLNYYGITLNAFTGMAKVDRP